MLPPTMSTSSLPYSMVQSTASLCGGLSTLGPSGNDTEPQSLTNQSKEVANTIWIYMGPIIFFVGLVGNILILVVMSCKRMRGTSTSDYLIIMAVADLLTIITGMIPEWLEAMGIFVLQTWNPATCKIYKFLVYTFGDTATWIRVLFTLDRFMAICFPMKKTDCCLAWRAKYYCLGALLAAVAKNLHVFWTRGAEYETTTVYEYVDCVLVPTNETASNLKSNCGYPTPECRYFETYVRPWIVFALVNFIPFCIILVCNIFIIRAMIQMKRVREERRLTTKSSDWQLFQTTAMCLGASFTFLVTVTPTMVLLIGKPYWTSNGTNMAYDIAKSISNQLLYLNNSVNFFLYCITGKKFRETLAMVLRCRCADLKKLDVSGGRPNTFTPGSTTAPSGVNGVRDEYYGRRSSKPDSTSRKNSNQDVGLELQSNGERTVLDAKINGNQLEETVVVEEKDGRTTLAEMEEGILVDDVVITQLGKDFGETRKEGGPASIRNRSGSESSSGVSSSTSNEDKPPITLNPINAGENGFGDCRCCTSANQCNAKDHCSPMDQGSAEDQCTTEYHCSTEDHCSPECRCSLEYHCSSEDHCSAEDHCSTEHRCSSTNEDHIADGQILKQGLETDHVGLTTDHGLADAQYSNTVDHISVNSLVTDRTNTADSDQREGCSPNSSNLVKQRSHPTVLFLDTDNCEHHTAVEMASEDIESDENTSQSSWEERDNDLQNIKIDNSHLNATSDGHLEDMDDVICKNNYGSNIDSEAKSANAEKLEKMIREGDKFNGNVDCERETFQGLEFYENGWKNVWDKVTIYEPTDSIC